TSMLVIEPGDSTSRVDSKLTDPRVCQFSREDDPTVICERDEPCIERRVVRWRQQETVVRVEPLAVVRVPPRLDVRVPQEQGKIEAGRCAQPGRAPHDALPELPLADSTHHKCTPFCRVPGSLVDSLLDDIRLIHADSVEEQSSGTGRKPEQISLVAGPESVEWR